MLDRKVKSKGCCFPLYGSRDGKLDTWKKDDNFLDV
jgi:hypothetical protein